MKKTLNNLDDTKKMAEILRSKISASKNTSATLITLSGDLGAGKTTFTQKFGESLKIKEKINSPTFVISKIYKINSKEFIWENLIHIDAYRLERENDMELIGLSEQLKNPENLIFLEWPEMVEKWLPKKNRIDIKLRYLDENTREIEF